jgi:uncharacterized protein YijF (DUF1287 family)
MRFRRCCMFIFFTCFLCNVKAQSNFGSTLADSAFVLTKTRVVYDPAYRSIPYPMGDVPANTGVCTDVVIRAYRKLGIDLQQLVHEDMRDHFSLYPKKWGLSRPDKNIDHRRVPNLMVFFERFGTSLPISNNPENFQPGDIVCWQLDRGMTHIGIVAKRKSSDRKRHLIIHNIGAGQVAEDMLFRFPIIGHYRYGGLD